MLINLQLKPQDDWAKAHDLCKDGLSDSWPYVFYGFGASGVLERSQSTDDSFRALSSTDDSSRALSVHRIQLPSALSPHI